MRSFVTLICLIFVSSILAQVPRTFNYQGKLTDPDGVAIIGIHSVECKIYNSPTGGTFLWSEIHPSVDVSHGLFDIVLGSVSPIVLPFDEQYWIELVVNGETMAPRQPLSSVPSAFRALWADSTNWAGNVHWDSIDGIPDSIYSPANYWRRDGTVLLPSFPNDKIEVTVDRTASFAIAGSLATTTAATGDRGGVIGVYKPSGTTVASGYLGYNGTGTPAIAGVYGKYSGSTGERYGVYGENTSSASVTKYGVYGRSGITGGNRYGVVGDASNAGGGTSRIGVTGLSGATSISPSNVDAALAGFAVGGDYAIYGYVPSSLTHNVLGLASNVGGTEVLRFAINTRGDLSSMGDYIFERGANDGTMTSAALTSARTWTFPNASGTIALTSDIPVSDHYQYWRASDGTTNTNITSTSTLTFASSGGVTTTLAGNTLTIDASAAGDDWGTQVVQSDATLSGDGSAGSPLGVVWGSVTQHTDVTSAGSGAIITLAERANLHAPGSDNQNLFNRVSDGTNTYTVASQTDILSLTATGGAAVSVNPATGVVTIDASAAGDDWGSQVASTSARLTGDGTSGSPLDIAQQGASSGQALKWNGTSWAPAADNNTTYSAGNGISLSGTTFSVAAGTGLTQDASGLSHTAHTGDATGASALTVVGIQGRSVTSTAPSSNQVLKWNGSAWAPANDDGGTDSQNLSYTASTRALGISGGTGVTLPLVTSTDAGLAPSSGGGTANYLRADGTWATPPGTATGTITEVVAGNGLIGGGTSGSVTIHANPDNRSIEVASDSLKVKAMGIKDFHIDWGSGAGQVDADDVPFSPSTAGDWSMGVDPGDVDDALDQLANRVKGIEGGTGSVTQITGGTGISPDGPTSGAVTLSINTSELSLTGLSAPAATSLNVLYGTSANTAVQGNQTATITAGSGLTGGIAGDALGDGFSATLNVNFAGSGSATTVSRSDHTHAGTYDNYGSWNLQANSGATTAITSGTSVNFTGTGGASVSRSGTTITIDASAAGDNWGSQVASTSARLTGDGTSGSPLDIAQQGASSGQALKWNGTSWAPAADNNTTYSAGNGISLSGTTFSVAAGTGLTQDASGLSHTAHTGDATGASALTVVGIQGRSVTSTAPSSNQVLKWNGSAWAPANDEEGTGTVTSIVTNNGITGGPITTSGTIGLTGQALALHNLSSNGLIARTGSGTVAARTITAGSGISVTNGNGVSGNPTITNEGVTSLTAGTGISLSGGTGAVNISNSAPWTSSSGDYIQNQSASTQTGNFRISSYASTNNLAPSSRYGFASQSTAGSSGTGWDASSIYAGVYGRVAGSHSTHAGVYGATTTNLGPNAAVLGYSSNTSLTPNTVWGALGYVETSNGNNWAGYFNGNVYSSGYIGINTTSPSARLHVNGTARFQGLSASTQTTILTVDGSGNVYTRAAGDWTGGPNYWTLSGSNLYPNSTAYNVGIGTTAPAYKLDVNGYFRVNSTSYPGRDYRIQCGSRQDIYANNDLVESVNGNKCVIVGVSGGANDQFQVAGLVEGTKIFVVDGTDQRVGIGTISPSTQLHTTGGVRFQGMGSTASNTDILTRDANGNLAYRAAGDWTGGPNYWTDAGNYLYPNGGIGTYLQVADVQSHTYGFYADMTGSYGVYGRAATYGGYFISNSTSDNYGVYGSCANNPYYGYGGYFTGGWYGVRGNASMSGTGTRYGVYGYGANGDSSNYGIYGSAYGGSTAYGVYGYASGATTNWAGYFSTGNVYMGGNVGIKTTNPTSPLYVYGNQAAGNPSVYLTARNDNWAIWAEGESGYTGGGGAFGSLGGGWGLVCTGGSKSAVVKTSEGPTALFCMESPEVWFEDIGGGRLVDGKAHIEIDPIFLQTVTIDDDNPMRVFIQPNGESNGLIVIKGKTGFDVFEQNGGTSNIEFDYRILAKRKYFEKDRLTVWPNPTHQPNPAEDADIKYISEQLRGGFGSGN